MQRLTIDPRVRPLAIVGGVAAVAGVALIVVLHWWSVQAVDDARRAALAAASDDELLRLMQSWADDHEDLTFFVARLSDERAATASAAGEVLRRRLIDWQALRSEVSSPSVARLARMLAHDAQRRGPAGRRAASSVAQRLLLWPLDEAAVDVPTVLCDCDTVLRADTAGSSNSLLSVADTRTAGDAAMMLQRRDDASSTVTNLDIAPLLPGGGIPLDVAALPESAATIVAETSTSEPSPGSQPFTEPEQIYAPLATPLKLLEGKQHADDRTAEQPDDELRRTTMSDQFGGAAGSSRYEAADEWSLMQLLHNPREALAAERELLRRGHTANSLAIARGLTHPNPGIRRAMVEMLTQLPDINPQPWLLQLARDPDAEVRRTAITILASSQHASITRWLEQIRETETQPNVAAAIDDLLRRRR